MREPKAWLSCGGNRNMSKEKKLSSLITTDKVEVYGLWALNLEGLNNPQEYRAGIL